MPFSSRNIILQTYFQPVFVRATIIFLPAFHQLVYPNIPLDIPINQPICYIYIYIYMYIYIPILLANSTRWSFIPIFPWRKCPKCALQFPPQVSRGFLFCFSKCGYLQAIDFLRMTTPWCPWCPWCPGSQRFLAPGLRGILKSHPLSMLNIPQPVVATKV